MDVTRKSTSPTQQKPQRRLHPRPPGCLRVLGALELECKPIYAAPVARGGHVRIHRHLEWRVLRVEGGGAIVEVEAMAAGCRQQRRHAVHQLYPADRPVRRQAAGAPKDLGILAERIE